MIRRVLATVLGGAAGLYLVICVFFFFAQRAMVFPAPRGERPSPAAGTVVRGDGFRALDAPVRDARAPWSSSMGTEKMSQTRAR